MINIITPPGIVPEKDELYRSEKSDAYKRRDKLKSELRATEYEIQQLHSLDRESRGLEAATIDSDDLIKIIEQLLANTSTVSKAFERHEVNNNKCAHWARRVLRYPVDKTKLSSALDKLEKHTGLTIMKKYKVLDVKDILRSASYSAALIKLKKRLDIANTFQDKDNQLFEKECTISARDAKIEELNEELLRDKSKDWKLRAVELKHADVSVTDIALRLGKSRGTVSTYLSSAERGLVEPRRSI
jgi:hypothetical protein